MNAAGNFTLVTFCRPPAGAQSPSGPEAALPSPGPRLRPTAGPRAASAPAGGDRGDRGARESQAKRLARLCPAVRRVDSDKNLFSHLLLLRVQKIQ